MAKAEIYLNEKTMSFSYYNLNNLIFFNDKDVLSVLKSEGANYNIVPFDCFRQETYYTHQKTDLDTFINWYSKRRSKISTNSLEHLFKTYTICSEKYAVTSTLSEKIISSKTNETIYIITDINTKEEFFICKSDLEKI
jgi:hypothetical protein